MAGESAQVSTPGIEDSGCDSRFGDMIQHKYLVRMLADECNRHGELMLKNQQVVHQSGALQGTNTSGEVVAQEEIRILLSLHNMAQTQQELARAKCFEFLTEIRAANVRPANNTANPLVLLRHLQQPPCFCKRLPRLYRNHAVNTRCRKLRREILREHVALKIRHGCVDPRILRL